MKLSAFSSIPKRSTKEYLLYAFGEVFLIVVGILLAMYINKLNEDYQYRKKIDKNITRVYAELEKNLSNTGSLIQALQQKDSMINLFMSGSLERSDFLENGELAALPINSHNLELEMEAYHNLVQLNISDNKYKDSLVSDLKGLYKLHHKIDLLNEKLSDFVVRLLSEDVEAYEGLTHKGKVDDRLIDHCLNSKRYRHNVIQYIVLGIRNQLRRYQVFYADGMDVYKAISRQYDLPNAFEYLTALETIDTLTGTYVGLQNADTAHVEFVHDSVLIHWVGYPKMHIVPYAQNRLFQDIGRLGYFVSFFPQDSAGINMRFQLITYSQEYKKLDSGD